MLVGHSSCDAFIEVSYSAGEASTTEVNYLETFSGFDSFPQAPNDVVESFFLHASVSQMIDLTFEDSRRFVLVEHSTVQRLTDARIALGRSLYKPSVKLTLPDL